MRRALLRGSLTGLAQAVVTTLLVLAVVPLFVRVLGPEAYGLFSLLAVVGSLNSIANLGLNASLVRFVAQHGKSRDSDQVILLTLLLLLGILIPLVACGLFFERFVLENVLQVPSRLTGGAEWLYVTMLLSSALVLFGQTFSGILDGCQKVHLTNVSQMIYSLLYWGLILVVIVMGHSLDAIGTSVLVSTALWVCLVALMAFRTWGGLSMVGFALNGKKLAKEQLSYGLQMYSAGIIGILYEPLTKVLVASLLGVREVGIFDIGLRVRNQIQGLIVRLYYPLYPLLASLNDFPRIRALIHDIEQKTAFMVFPAIGSIALAAYPAVQLFFENDVELIATTIVWFVAAFLLGSIMVTPFYQFLMAKGHASKTIVLQGVNVLVSLVFFLMLRPWIGYYAVVVSSSIAILSSGALSLYFQRRLLESLIFDSVRQVTIVGAAFLASLGAGYLMGTMVDAIIWKVSAAPIAAFVISVLLYRQCRLLSPPEITRYLGSSTAIARVSVRLLCSEVK